MSEILKIWNRKCQKIENLKNWKYQKIFEKIANYLSSFLNLQFLTFSISDIFNTTQFWNYEHPENALKLGTTRKRTDFVYKNFETIEILLEFSNLEYAENAPKFSEFMQNFKA